MLWGTRSAKRKILCNSHAFWPLPVACLILGACGGALFCLVGLPALEPELLTIDPAAVFSGLFSTFARCARFPAFLYLIAFSRYALPFACGALFARGFLLSYAVGSVCAISGAAGIFQALALELVSGFALLPYLLVLARWAIARRGRRPDRQAVAVGVLTFLLVLAAAVVDGLLAPRWSALFTYFDLSG